MKYKRFFIIAGVLLTLFLALLAAGSPSTQTTAAEQAEFVPRAYLPSVSNPFAFTPLLPAFLPNCGLTQIKGTIEMPDGTPVNGITVRVWWDGAGEDQVYSLPSGEDPTKPDGYWDVVLAPYPKAGKWYVAVVDRDGGEELSEVTTVWTDVGPCQPGGSGHQVVIVDFIRLSDNYGTPVPENTS